MMGPGGALNGYGDDASDLDPDEDLDLQDDPIFALDLPVSLPSARPAHPRLKRRTDHDTLRSPQAHLKAFFQAAYATDANGFKGYAGLLNEEEQGTLGRVLAAA